MEAIGKSGKMVENLQSVYRPGRVFKRSLHNKKSKQKSEGPNCKPVMNFILIVKADIITY